MKKHSLRRLVYQTSQSTKSCIAVGWCYGKYIVINGLEHPLILHFIEAKIKTFHSHKNHYFLVLFDRSSNINKLKQQTSRRKTVEISCADKNSKIFIMLTCLCWWYTETNITQSEPIHLLNKWNILFPYNTRRK